MDQLDILKKDWNKQESIFQQLSQNELSALIHKRSSSIVKWIFIISILEFVLPLVIMAFTGIEKESMQGYEALGLSNFMIGFYGVTTFIIFYFIFKFYKNYTLINAHSSPKKLLQNILNTRKTVRHYIWFNLAMIPILVSVVLYQLLNLNLLPADTNTLVVVLLALVVMLILIGLVWLYYKIVYGVLLNKLSHNYNELIRSDTDCD